MSNEIGSAKAPAIAAELRQRIRAGGYRDTQLTSRELAAEYGVNPKTVNKALRCLVEEDLVVRVPGRGTFVQTMERGPAASQRNFAVVGQLSGHLFQDLSGALFRGIQDAGDLPIPLDPEVGGFASAPERFLARLFEQNPEGMVVIGTPTTPYRSLWRHQDEIDRLVFVLRLESDLPIRAAAALSDYWYGTYIATRHLIEQGHDRIIFLTHERDDDTAPPPERRHKGFVQQLDGYRQALREDGDRREYVVRQPAHVFDALGPLPDFSAPDAPTAIVADSDHRLIMTLRAMDAAGIGAGLKTPCVGFFNTPWADWLPGGLTSVSIRQDELAAVALRLLLAPETTYERMTVKPELVLRQSSRAG